MKPNGKVRICDDFKVTINPYLVVPQYPVPRVQDLLSELKGGQKFTKLDLSHAYQQVVLANESRDYVAINTHMRLYRYTRLPYGVSLEPAICQETMDKVLAGLQGVGCIMDDLIVSGKDDVEHLCHLEAALERLTQYGIQLNINKCEFMKTQVGYFGIIVDKDGVHPSSGKVAAIADASEPKNVAQLQSFLGCINYYRVFIPSLATMAPPLTDMLKKGVPWNWNKQCQGAFKQVKQALMSAQLLVHYDPQKKIILTVDASTTGVGAVICHQFAEGDRPIAYVSRTLNQGE